MDNLNNIPNVGNWGDVSSRINDNFSKVNNSITRLDNIEQNRKGYFVDDVELKAAYPNPKVGWYAYVGSTNTIWKAYNNNWVDSGEVIPSDVDLSGYAKSDDIIVSQIFELDSNFTKYPKGSIIDFEIQPTADIAVGDNYYIKYIYNENSRFLIQIVNDNNDVISQYYLPTSNLTGIQKLHLINRSNNLPFAEVVVNPAKCPTWPADFGKNFHLKTSALSLASLTEAFMSPGGELQVNKDGYNIHIHIPINTRIYQANYVYMTADIINIKDNFIGLKYLVHNKIDKTISLIPISSNNIDYRSVVILGRINTYGQRQIINSTLFSVDGVQQKFIQLPKSLFWHNPTNDKFNYDSFIRLEAVSGDPYLLYNEDGSLRQLYLTFLRLKTNGTPATNIVQISYKDGDSVGLSNKIFASSSDTREMSNRPITSFDIKGVPEVAKGIEFSCIIDTSKITSSILNSIELGDTLQLNTLLFLEQLKAVEASNKQAQKELYAKKIVCFGDSVTEFGDYPEQIEQITGATTYKVGFGGCRMGKRLGDSEVIKAYDELSMYKISEAVATQEFDNMEWAINYLKNNAGDDNTTAFNVLKEIDFNDIDIVTIFFGTNDFTSNENTIGEEDSDDSMEMKGAINIVVDNLLSSYPHLNLLFITPTHRMIGAQSSDNWRNGLGLKLVDFCDAIEEQATRNHLPTINLHNYSGLNVYNHNLYFKDQVHPNSNGYKYLARKISASLLKCF